MNEKIIEIEPGTNRFKVVGVQQFGTVEPKEWTEGGYPKNTTIDLTGLYVFWNPETETWSITVLSGV